MGIAGFPNHLFARMHLLGYRFAPRTRNIGDTRLYISTNDSQLSTLAPLIGGTLNTKTIAAHWDELLRLAASIKTGTHLFLFDWLQSPGLRRKMAAGLDKGEARARVFRAVFFNRLGQIRDRSFEHQRYLASGMNLLSAAIFLWNTVYLERTITTLNQEGNAMDPELRRFFSPVGWEHIKLTRDYTWPRTNQIKPGRYRP